MVNFWAIDTLPAQYTGRNLYRHNPQVTLIRTTAAESRQIGFWIAEKLHRCDGPLRSNAVHTLNEWGGSLTMPAAYEAPGYAGNIHRLLVASDNFINAMNGQY
jgi:uncharacterized protein (UPF0261 family)